MEKSLKEKLDTKETFYSMEKEEEHIKLVISNIKHNIREAVEDYLHYEDPNYSEDEYYFYNKYGITILDTEKDIFRKIFGDWEE